MAASPPFASHLKANSPVPESILIIGAGVFGLSTTLTLLSSPRYDRTQITLVDPYLPSLDDFSSPAQQRQQQQQPVQNPHAASIDSSRIIRPDYAESAYAKLARTAQEEWRKGYGQFRGGKGGVVHRESGVILATDESGSRYVDKARLNAGALGYDVQALGTGEEIENLFGTGGGSGKSGYVNWGSGWADNGRAMEACMKEAVERARSRGKQKGKVVFRRGKVRRLVFGIGVVDETQQRQGKPKRVLRVELEDRQELRADLTIVAAGAWSGALVDLRGRAEARGQVVAYVPISEQEAERLKRIPVLLNLSTGMFVIPPVRDAILGEWVLKIARHGYGYANPTTVSPEGKSITTSLPHAKFSPIPPEGATACRDFLRQTVPWLGDRGFASTRICWYTDTPSGDFLVSYHPAYSGLFLATGGSGHGFKFLPVLGEKIVAGVEGRLEDELERLWRWKGKGKGVVSFEGTEDGSRGGRRGMVLEEEWSRGREVGGRHKL